jgi:hypothetical protein
MNISESDYEALVKAWVILGRLGGNMAESEFREAWLAMRDAVQLQLAPYADQQRGNQ